MSKKSKKARARERPMDAVTAFMVCDGDLSVSGYTSLSKSPEIISAVTKIASMISSMTIHLMANTENGDVRIKNALSRKIDIEPYRFGTRQTFIHAIVRNMLLDGDGNSFALPITKNGLIDDIVPLPPGMVSMIPDGYGYSVSVAGDKMDPSEILHFVCNPDPLYPWKGTGFRVALRDVANNLKQASATEKGFMESKWKPSIIVKVDAMADAFSGKEGRRKLLDEYIATSEAGEPWLIPAEQFSVEQVKPLSLSDLAISDMVQINKRTVASILGVPPFVLGVGEFNRGAWNNFIDATVMPIVRGIEQELTKKLLYSESMYFKFNPRSLYSYSMENLAKVGDDQYVRGIMTGNEVRDWLGMTPKEGLDELVILENYIPLGNIGDQKKLMQNGGEKIGAENDQDGQDGEEGS